jgi:hypothetical protein
VELLVLFVTVVAARILVAPLVRRIPSPAWYERAKLRGRPGIPITTGLGTLLLMGLFWLIGERRGVVGAVLLVLWIAVPAAAWEILRSWRRRPRGI